MAEVDWERLKNPPEPFKLIVPDYKDIGFHKKVIKLKDHLMNKYLETSDENRTEERLEYAVKGGLFSYGTAMYEAGDLDALVGFVNILPGFKCGLIFSLLDKKIWGKQFARAGQQLIKMYMEEFDLKRVGSQTADPKVKRLAEIIGFKDEGTRPKNFMWNQKLYPVYLLGMTREEE